jgi:CRISPR/Cas system CSM-associated protein Csm3 (group 7 of RAMP superfamily)
MSNTISWTGTLTATSSIAHGGETRGTITLLRRELVALPDGRLVHLPIISGNSLRGRLRRIGEELLRDVLCYEGQLSPAAAHALRGGGSLAKTAGEPLSGNRLQTLRNLVPQVGVFGAAGGGCIIDGALDVGKVVPHVTETNHITGSVSHRSAFEATQIESYTRQDDTDTHDFTTVIPTAALSFDESGLPELDAHGGSQQMLYRIETFPAGTVFSTWLRLRRATDLEAAFFKDVMKAFTADGRLGGRVGIGHGQVRVNLKGTAASPPAKVDWRTITLEHRAQILTALESLA